MTHQQNPETAIDLVDVWSKVNMTNSVETVCTRYEIETTSVYQCTLGARVNRLGQPEFQ